MSLAEDFLGDFDMEMAKSRQTLERLVDEELDWRPHPKSWTMGELGSHLANLLNWTESTMTADSLDVSPESPPPPRQSAESREEALEMFDASVAAARAAIANASDETLRSTWSLMSEGNVLFAMPRISVLRAFILHHAIHHRAQLGMYLRLCDLPMPALYGPSADESGM